VPAREWRLRISDILQSISKISGYTQGMDFETFRGDSKTVDAVVHNLAIIGEAAANVPDEIASGHPEIPWRIMKAFRNVIVHEYFGVTLDIVWQTVRKDLPTLVGPLQRLLDQDQDGPREMISRA